MSNKFKIYMLVFYFSFMYGSMLLGILDNEFKLILPSFFVSAGLLYINIIYTLYMHKLLLFSIFMKILFFTLFLISYLFIEQLFVYIFLYGVDGVGYLQNNGFVDYQHRFSDFSWQEKLYWHFIFSLYYPVYIFIFIKPFVNHLDKSIRKIKKENISK
ncbi:MAG: hypothetical protein AB7D34_03945 [Sulfurimonas sp.]